MSEYNVYAERDCDAIWSAVRNLALDDYVSLSLNCRWMIQQAIEALADANNGDDEESERILTVEIQAARDVLKEQPRSIISMHALSTGVDGYQATLACGHELILPDCTKLGDTFICRICNPLPKQ